MDTQEERLDLTSLDPCRTTLVNANDPQRVVYSATTDESGSKPITTFADASGSVIATLEWHLHSSDKLSIRGAEKSDVSKWLQRKKWRKGHGVSFSDEKNGKYTWEKVEGSSSLQLFTDTDADADADASSPIATFIAPSGKKSSTGHLETKPASILLSEHAQGIRDEVVLSALLLEKANRTSGIFSADWGLMGILSLNIAF